ncbi:putative proline-rich protein PRCC [Rosa chinensis]|uniref:Putative proline-rich protein PRCC n=1 Tax=Rosa chinensis TaxID=74649 RepID=A0A2P6QSI4_ROSCH|nr:proline-rich receptor-like protein kinase PERK13 [Rosa chinensis]PRQ37143.1 putative proline-rich protein PRCC [Rosa chinensis]
MDSLLANYASSDEEEDQKPHHHHQLQPPPNPSSSSSSSLFSSLPKPKPEPEPSSFFNSLPPPKQTHSNPPHQEDQDSKPTSRSSLFSSLPKPKPSSLFQSLPKPKLEPQEEEEEDIKPPSSVFSSLPPPKSQIPNKPISNSSSSPAQIPKRVVQFKPPINPYFANSSHLEDDDDDEEEEERRRRKASEASSAQPLSVTSFLSAIPAPRNSGVNSGLGSGVGSGRRATVETESCGSKVESDVGLDRNENVASYDDPQSNFDPNAEGYGGYESYQYGVDQNVDSGVSGGDGSSYGSYSGYGGYNGYAGNHGNEWADGSGTAAAMGVSGDTGVKVSGKRRRNDVPTEILEVKQDELMKNRPREDQAKVTGIAFGPSYQPVSTKGKPTKLHKRKHQIGSLYFDMKQKEMELQERRSRGFLTKAETQAKYGW